MHIDPNKAAKLFGISGVILFLSALYSKTDNIAIYDLAMLSIFTCGIISAAIIIQERIKKGK